jgi:DNA primase
MRQRGTEFYDLICVQYSVIGVYRARRKVGFVNFSIRNDKMNILDLIQNDKIIPAHVGGGEWRSPCPECGGIDRFSFWPSKINRNGRYGGGRYDCHQCGIRGDAIQYLMNRRGIPFPEAVKVLGLDHESLQKIPKTRRKFSGIPKTPYQPQPELWRTMATEFASTCQSRLEGNSEAISWLKERGLNLDTIRAAGLGWNDQDIYLPRESWGLPPGASKVNGYKRLWIPAGLTLPLRSGNTSAVTRLRIRLRTQHDNQRYTVVTGSSMAPMALWSSQADVCVVEGELDLLLIHQEAGDLVGVIGLGSCTQLPDPALDSRLMTIKSILVALDSDPAGDTASEFWARYLGFRRWSPVPAKDPGEMFRAGISIRKWIEDGLAA